MENIATHNLTVRLRRLVRFIGQWSATSSPERHEAMATELIDAVADIQRGADEIERLTDEANTYCKWWREKRDRVKELEAALAAEREECAKVAEEISPLTAGKVIAAAIRARGQK